MGILQLFFIFRKNGYRIRFGTLVKLLHAGLPLHQLIIIIVLFLHFQISISHRKHAVPFLVHQHNANSFHRWTAALRRGLFLLGTAASQTRFATAGHRLTLMLLLV
jgi:hypothetical protein|tara:strand:- start:172 stop:489 length:318 start_codon:yes stop_codon:yes gene_type:complete